jgi:hypothetical protein
MKVGSDAPIAARPAQSEFDKRAISAAGHLLMGGVWVERQLVMAQRLLGTLFWSPEFPNKRSTLARPGTPDL